MAAATVVGAFLRVVSPGNGSLTHDEALFLYLTGPRTTFAEMLEVLRVHEFNPPLFYLIMRAWIELAGMAADSVVPIVTAVALIPVVYRVGATAFTGLAGVVAAWVVALSPPLVFFSPQIRPYSLFMLAAVGSCALFWRLGEGRKFWLGYVACTLAMVLTHNWGWIVVAAQTVLGILGPVLFKGQVAAPSPARIVSAWFAVGIAYLPWLPVFVAQALYRGYPPQDMSLMRAAFLLPRTAFGPAAAPAGFLFLAVLVLVPFLPQPPQIQVTTSKPGRVFVIGFVPLVCMAIAWPLSSRSALLLPHTIAALLPLVALLIGGVVAALWLSGRRTAAVVAAVAAAALTAADLGHRLRLQKSNAESVAFQVASHARDRDVIIVAPEWLVTSFNHYFPLPNRQIVYPDFSRKEIVPYERAYVPLTAPEPMIAAADTIAALRRRGARVWLVTVRDGVADSVGRGEMALPDTFDVYEVGAIRGNQLRHELTRRFGPPDTTVVSPDSRPGIEMMRAMLFE